jgi:hypothetical protein
MNSTSAAAAAAAGAAAAAAGQFTCWCFTCAAYLRTRRGAGAG